MTAPEKKKSDTWMPFYVGDYLAATSRLTTEQHGAYLLILLDYWKNGPPPNDDAVLCQIARMSSVAWRKAKPALIGFFEIRDGVLMQKRVERERVKASKITDKRSEAGKIGAEKRWQTHGKRMANANDLPMANGKQNDAPSQPPLESNHNLHSTLPREEIPEGITDAALAFEYVCIAADWHPSSDTQRQVNLSVLAGWLALGCSLELILDAIAKAIARKPDEETKSFKRFDSTIRGMRRDQLGGELPVTGADVEAVTSGLGKRMSVGGG